jgi:hypothetical protein
LDVRSYSESRLVIKNFYNTAWHDQIASVLHQGGLIVAIIMPGRGIDNATGAATDITIPEFSFAPNDALAQMVVEAWSNENFRKQLLERMSPGTADPGAPTAVAVKAATDAVNAAGFNLLRAVVISEDEHDKDYKMRDPDTEVVFVLPNYQRLGTAFVPGKSLIDTARILMGCTPNGI